MTSFSGGYTERKSYSMKITDATHLTERMNSESDKIDGNVELLHRDHVMRFNSCIKND